MAIRFSFRFLAAALVASSAMVFSAPLHAQNQKPEVEIDFSVLKDLNPSRQPVENNLSPTTVQPVTREPAKSPDIQQFPVTQKVRSDGMNPGAPATAPAPTPEVAASLAPEKAKKKTAKPVKVKKAAAKKSSQLSKKKVAQKAPVKKGKAREAKKTIVVPAKPPEVLSLHADDPLEKKLTVPDKKKLAKDIEAVHKTADIPFAPSPETDAGKKVITPAENVSGPAVLEEKQGMPRPPPEDPREINFFTVPFKPGTDGLDKQVTETLKSQVLPLLRDHPSWRLQIEAFASPVDKEPISARRISLARALAVRSWLLDKGVEARRLDLKALGLQTNREPPDRVDMVFVDPGLPGG